MEDHHLPGHPRLRRYDTFNVLRGRMGRGSLVGSRLSHSLATAGWCVHRLAPLPSSRPLTPTSVTAVKAFVDLSHGEHHAEEAPDYPYLHSTC